MWVQHFVGCVCVGAMAYSKQQVIDFIHRALYGYELRHRVPKGMAPMILRAVFATFIVDPSQVTKLVDKLQRPQQECNAILETSGGLDWFALLARDPGQVIQAHLVALGKPHNHSVHLISRLSRALGSPQGGLSFFQQLEEHIRAHPCATAFKDAMLQLVTEYETPSPVSVSELGAEAGACAGGQGGTGAGVGTDTDAGAGAGAGAGMSGASSGVESHAHSQSGQAHLVSIVYKLVSGVGNRCWWRCVSEALGIPEGELHRMILDALKAIKDPRVLFALHLAKYSVPSADQVDKIVGDFVTGNFKSMQWGGTTEMMVLSYVYGGGLSFLTVNNQKQPFQDVRYVAPDGPCVQPTKQIALHHCNINGDDSHGLNHWNLLTYRMSDSTEPLKHWPSPDNDKADSQQRRYNMLVDECRQASKDTARAEQQRVEKDAALAQSLATQPDPQTGTQAPVQAATQIDMHGSTQADAHSLVQASTQASTQANTQANVGQSDMQIDMQASTQTGTQISTQIDLTGSPDGLSAPTCTSTPHGGWGPTGQLEANMQAHVQANTQANVGHSDMQIDMQAGPQIDTQASTQIASTTQAANAHALVPASTQTNTQTNTQANGKSVEPRRSERTRTSTAAAPASTPAAPASTSTPASASAPASTQASVPASDTQIKNKAKKQNKGKGCRSSSSKAKSNSALVTRSSGRLVPRRNAQRHAPFCEEEEFLPAWMKELVGRLGYLYRTNPRAQQNVGSLQDYSNQQLQQGLVVALRAIASGVSSTNFSFPNARASLEYMVGWILNGTSDPMMDFLHLYEEEHSKEGDSEAEDSKEDFEDEDSEEQVECEVECILAERKFKDGQRFQVKWANCSKDEATWEPRHHVQHLDAYKEFQRAKKRAAKQGVPKQGVPKNKRRRSATPSSGLDSETEAHTGDGSTALVSAGSETLSIGEEEEEEVHQRSSRHSPRSSRSSNHSPPPPAAKRPRTDPPPAPATSGTTPRRRRLVNDGASADQPMLDSPEKGERGPTTDVDDDGASTSAIAATPLKHPRVQAAPTNGDVGVVSSTVTDAVPMQVDSGMPTTSSGAAGFSGAALSGIALPSSGVVSHSSGVACSDAACSEPGAASSLPTPSPSSGAALPPATEESSNIADQPPVAGDVGASMADVNMTDMASAPSARQHAQHALVSMAGVMAAAAVATTSAEQTRESLLDTCRLRTNVKTYRFAPDPSESFVPVFVGTGTHTHDKPQTNATGTKLDGKEQAEQHHGPYGTGDQESEHDKDTESDDGDEADAEQDDGSDDSDPSGDFVVAKDAGESSSSESDAGGDDGEHRGRTGPRNTPHQPQNKSSSTPMPKKAKGHITVPHGLLEEKHVTFAVERMAPVLPTCSDIRFRSFNGNGYLISKVLLSRVVSLVEGISESDAAALLKGHNACLVLTTGRPDKASQDQGLSASLREWYAAEPLVVYYLCLHSLIASSADQGKTVDVLLAWVAMLASSTGREVLRQVVKVKQVRAALTTNIFRCDEADVHGLKGRCIGSRDDFKYSPILLHVGILGGTAASSVLDGSTFIEQGAKQGAAFRIRHAVLRRGSAMWTALLKQHACLEPAGLLELMVVAPVSTPTLPASARGAVMTVLQALEHAKLPDQPGQTARWIEGLLKLARQADGTTDSASASASDIVRLSLRVVAYLSDAQSCLAASDDGAARMALLCHLLETYTHVDQSSVSTRKSDSSECSEMDRASLASKHVDRRALAQHRGSIFARHVFALLRGPIPEEWAQQHPVLVQESTYIGNDPDALAALQAYKTRVQNHGTTPPAQDDGTRLRRACRRY